jgi:hypothetical protein
MHLLEDRIGQTNARGRANYGIDIAARTHGRLASLVLDPLGDFTRWKHGEAVETPTLLAAFDLFPIRGAVIVRDLEFPLIHSSTRRPTDQKLSGFCPLDARDSRLAE